MLARLLGIRSSLARAAIVQTAARRGRATLAVKAAARRNSLQAAVATKETHSHPTTTARAFNSSANVLRATANDSKKTPPAPTGPKKNHLAVFSSNSHNPENSFLSAETIAKGCQRFRMGEASSQVLAAAFMHSLKSTDAKPISENPARYSLETAATYGGHPGAVGFFGQHGMQRLAELKAKCVTVDGELLLFKSTYEDYAKSVRANDLNGEAKMGYSCMQKFFGEKTADGEKFLTFDKLGWDKKYNPVSKLVEPYMPYSRFAQLIYDSRVTVDVDLEQKCPHSKKP